MVGRFVNADGAEWIGTNDIAIEVNIFCYCRNNCVNRADETGYGGIDKLLDALNSCVDIIAKMIDMIANNSYVTYIGVCEYESESVELVGEKVTIYVGKGHEIVPRGTNYGKCIYSKHSKVIVYWEPLLSNTCPVMEAH